MKSEKGMTMLSVIVYVVALVIVVGVISMVTTYFYNNIDTIGRNIEPSQEYVKFNSFFTSDINGKNNKVLECGENTPEETYIVFKNGEQYTYDAGSKAVYRNKVKICEAIESITFTYAIESSKEVVKVSLKMTGNENATNMTYTLAG